MKSKIFLLFSGVRRIISVLIICLLACACASCQTEGKSKHTSNQVSNSKHLFAELAATDNVVYYMTNYQEDGVRKFMYFDKASGFCDYLCGKPECAHDSLDCNAVAGPGSAYGMDLYDQKIYWIADKLSDNGSYEGRFLYRMNTDGTKHEEVRPIHMASEPEEAITGSAQVRYINGYVIIAGSRNLVSSGDILCYDTIRAYSITNPKMDFVIEDRNTSGRLYVHTAGNQLFYSLSTQERQEEKDWIQDSHLELCSYDFQTGETTTIYEGDVPFCLWEFSVSGDQIVISTYSDLQNINKAYILDMKQKTFTSDITIEPELTGMISYVDNGIISCHTYPNNNFDNYRIVLANADGEIVSDVVRTNIMLSENHHGRGRIFAGADSEYSYCFYREPIDGIEREWLVAYPRENGEAKVIYTNMTEEIEVFGEDMEKEISVRVDLDILKQDGKYSVDDISELKGVQISCYVSNNTDSDVIKFAECLKIGDRILANGTGDKWKANTSSLEMNFELDEFYAGDCSDGKITIRYEYTATLEADPTREIHAADEIEVMISPFMQ